MSHLQHTLQQIWFYCLKGCPEKAYFPLSPSLFSILADRHAETEANKVFQFKNDLSSTACFIAFLGFQCVCAW